MRTVLLCAALLLTHAAQASQDTPEAALSALWAAMSHEAGASADVATLDALFHADAVVFGGRYRNGEATLRRSSATEFLASAARPGDEAFHECEVARSVHVYDRFATAYSVVESRRDADAPAADFVGVNSIQLYRDGDRWTVLSLYYHVERDGVPVALDSGRTGRCIG